MPDVDAWIDGSRVPLGPTLRATRRSMQATGCRTRRSGSRRTGLPRASRQARPRASREPDQQRDVPRDEEERAEEPGLHAELRVVRLAGFERHVLAERDLARVAEPVALRVVDDGREAVPQVAEVRLASTARASSARARSRERAGTRARAREMRPRADVGEDGEKANPTTSVAAAATNGHGGGTRRRGRRSPTARPTTAARVCVQSRPTAASAANGARRASAARAGARRRRGTPRRAATGTSRRAAASAPARSRCCRRSSPAGARGRAVRVPELLAEVVRPCRCAATSRGRSRTRRSSPHAATAAASAEDRASAPRASAATTARPRKYAPTPARSWRSA